MLLKVSELLASWSRRWPSWMQVFMTIAANIAITRTIVGLIALSWIGWNPLDVAPGGTTPYTVVGERCSMYFCGMTSSNGLQWKNTNPFWSGVRFWIQLTFVIVLLSHRSDSEHEWFRIVDSCNLFVFAMLGNRFIDDLVFCSSVVEVSYAAATRTVQYKHYLNFMYQLPSGRQQSTNCNWHLFCFQPLVQRLVCCLICLSCH